MFTICLAVYGTLMSVTPEQQVCIKADKSYLVSIVDSCHALAHDPLVTCEARSSGALKWYVTVRKLDGVP